MAETYCPVLSGDPAIVVVEEGHNTFMNLATRTYELAVEQATAMAGFTAQPYAFDVNYNFTGQLAPFQRPQAPVIDFSQFNINTPTEPGLPPDYTPGAVTFADMPDDSGLDAPVLVFGPRPQAPDIVAPTEPATNFDLVVPDAPSYVLPDVPTLIDLNLPDAPNIVIPDFVAERPSFVEPPLDDSWTFQLDPYASDLMDLMKSKCEQFLNGDIALPVAIENALFDRDRNRILLENQAEIETIYDEFGARGFSNPPGMLAKRVDQSRKSAFDRIAQASTEAMIKNFDETLANMRLALQQGVALEGVAVNLHIEEQRLLLQSAQFQRETSIAILNARISVFNARLEAYRTDAQVYQSQIQAALARVEVYKAEIEAERVRGEINEQKIRIYTAQLQAVQTMADVYRTQIEALKAQTDMEVAKIDGYKAQVEAYGIRWNAYGQEWQAYKAQVDAENSKASIHKNLVDAYAARVQAVSSQNNSYIDRERLFIQEHQQRLNQYLAQLQKYTSVLEAERTRVQAVASGTTAQATIYNASANVEQAASAATDRSFQLGMENARANVDTQLQVAKTKVDENIQITQLQLELRKFLTQVMAQLASSSMSAVNYSASLGSSTSMSRACSTSFSFSGEIADA